MWFSVLPFFIAFYALSCGEPPMLPPCHDAGRSDAGDPDAPARTGFGPPVLISELASAAHERSPALASEGLTIYFTRTARIGGSLVNVPYRAARDTVDDPFGTPARPVAWGEVSVWDLEVANNDLELYFWTGVGQLHRSSRPNVAAGWSPPEPVGFDGFSPSLSGNLLALYFADRDGGIWRSSRETPVDPWLPPQPVGLEGAIEPIWIDVSADELTALITTDPRLSEAGVYLARRESIDDAFGRPEPIDTLEGPYEGARFRADGGEITFARAVGGDRELFHARRQLE